MPTIAPATVLLSIYACCFRKNCSSCQENFHDSLFGLQSTSCSVLLQNGVFGRDLAHAPAPLKACQSHYQIAGGCDSTASLHTRCLHRGLHSLLLLLVCWPEARHQKYRPHLLGRGQAISLPYLRLGCCFHCPACWVHGRPRYTPLSHTGGDAISASLEVLLEGTC